VLALTATIAVPVIGFASPAGAANNANAKACQQGGFVNYVTTSGTRFKNAGDCTSYAATGGTLVPLPDLVPDGSCTAGASVSCLFTIRNIGIGPATDAAIVIRADADISNLTSVGSQSASASVSCTGPSAIATLFPPVAQAGCTKITVLPGQTATMSVGVSVGGTGPVVVTVAVDTANTVLESNETNNTFSQTFTLPS
jgi:hypothetical protein